MTADARGARKGTPTPSDLAPQVRRARALRALATSVVALRDHLRQLGGALGRFAPSQGRWLGTWGSRRPAGRGSMGSGGPSRKITRALGAARLAPVAEFQPICVCCGANPGTIAWSPLFDVCQACVDAGGQDATGLLGGFLFSHEGDVQAGYVRRLPQDAIDRHELGTCDGCQVRAATTAFGDDYHGTLLALCDECR